MANTAQRTDPALWDKVKRRVTRGDKGGAPGEWSARKAQLAVQAYKKAGGGYVGGKRQDNSLARWTKEAWGTRSGRPSGETGERYLPKRARERLSREAYDRSTAKKRADTAKGRQFSAQPEEAARATAAARTPRPPARDDAAKTAAARDGAARRRAGAARRGAPKAKAATSNRGATAGRAAPGTRAKGVKTTRAAGAKNTHAAGVKNSRATGATDKRATGATDKRATGATTKRASPAAKPVPKPRAAASARRGRTRRKDAAQ